MTNGAEKSKGLTRNFPQSSLEKGRDAIAKILKNPTARGMVREERSKQKELREVAITDPLTGAYNRRYLEHQLRTDFHMVAGTVTHEKRQPYKTRLSEEIGLLIFDLDNFKDVNDSYGHNEGDAVLKRFSEVMKGAIRKEDVFARWGGEEFMLLIRESHKLTSEEIIAMVERYRNAIESKVTVGTQQALVTASIGLALFSGVDDTTAIMKPEDLISYADQAMFMAKANGRNQAWEFDGLGDSVFSTPKFHKIDSGKPNPVAASSPR